MDPNEKILSVLRYTSKVRLQNVLMKIPDREIAVSIMYLCPEERENIFALLSPAKVMRIKEELTYQRKLNIRYSRYLKFVDAFLSYFGSSSGASKRRSYIRPKR